MDQAVHKRAVVILDEWYQAYLEYLKYEHAHSHFRTQNFKPQTELITIAKQRILNVLESLKVFDEMVNNCIFTIGKPRVNKVRASTRYDWYFEKNRLYVVPTVFAHYNKLGSVSINKLSEFKRFGHKQSPLIPFICIIVFPILTKRKICIAEIKNR